MDEAIAEAKRVLEAAEAEEQQLELLEPLTAEEMAVAQEQLGPNAGRMTVLAKARENRRGRPPGVRNRRTDDFVRYISQFGPDPAVVMAQIAGTPEEVMVERSAAMDPHKRRLSWGDARAMRIRCAEALLPYYHGKQPVKVDATIRGVIVEEHIGELRQVGGAIIDAEAVEVGDLGDDA